MQIWIQYTDWGEWIGPPEDFHLSPDKGVVRMNGIDDFGRKVLCVYDDFYYAYPVENGEWIVGSGTNQREFRLVPGRDGAIGQERFNLPAGAVVRLGQQLSQEEAIAFGLIDEDGKLLSEKATVIAQVG